MATYNILINTCDKFEDCWDPFFKLWSIYWPDCNGKIFLNTEYKGYEYEGIDITPLKVCLKKGVPQSERATWSQCLKWALEAMDSDIVLYMQEDYFLLDKVSNDSIEYFLNLMNSSPEIPCIQLTNAGIPAVSKSKYSMLFSSNPDFFSYVSCQASLWRKDVLLSLIREHESAWNFEWWGSKRAKYLGYEFLVVDPEILESTTSGILPYVLTGVVGGKWFKPVVELFNKHQIEMDFSKRGFYDPLKKLSWKQRIKAKRTIWKFKSIVKIFNMKFFKYTPVSSVLSKSKK